MSKDRVAPSSEPPALEALEEVLAKHPVSFAMVFGSAARGGSDPPNDIDLAVEFSSLRPGEAGYNEQYFSLIDALETATDRQVDVVDVHTMPPTFARIAFDDGVRITGTAQRNRELEEKIAGDRPTFEDARKRVSKAAQRLREEFA